MDLYLWTCPVLYRTRVDFQHPQCSAVRNSTVQVKSCLLFRTYYLLASLYNPLGLYREKEWITVTNSLSQWHFWFHSPPWNLPHLSLLSHRRSTAYAAVACWKLFPSPWLSPTFLTTSFQFCHIILERRELELYAVFIALATVYLESNIKFSFFPLYTSNL